MNLYVSKLGNGSNGSSWSNAFHSIGQALLAIPDNNGGHRVIVRPDTYFEANLYTERQGAKNAYNELVGDFDGAFGSGTQGWVVIDSGDPALGFKSYDWWSTIRAYNKGWSIDHKDENFSSVCFDRWTFRHLYACGGDAGLFFDGVHRVEPFSVLVEDCVSIGRAFGGGVAGLLSRPDEPLIFRRCRFYALDYIGDTAAVYLRVENKTMPESPDVILEDCTMTAPQACIKSTNFGLTPYTWSSLKRCSLVQMNFSQPEMSGPNGTPPVGIITSVQKGDRMKVSFEDCTIMGYRAFGVMVETETAKDITYETKGDCRAYLQFKQELPRGFHRLGHWPAAVFASIAPPDPRQKSTLLQNRRLLQRNMMEICPVIWKGRLCRIECCRPTCGLTPTDYFIRLIDDETGREEARFAIGYSLASAIVENDTLYVFAARLEQDQNGESWNDVTMFKSSDLQHWENRIALRQNSDERLFNTSVCRGPNGFAMAYESNDPAYQPFTIKFAVSPDLEHWKKEPEAVFGRDRYTACPCLRYVDGHYYMMYLEHRRPEHYFHTFLARSEDLKHWKLSSANPMIEPEGLDEGINASDPEIIEFDGRTYVYFAVGDQLGEAWSWANLKVTEYPGPMQEFLQGFFDDGGITDAGSSVVQR